MSEDEKTVNNEELQEAEKAAKEFEPAEVRADSPVELIVVDGTGPGSSEGSAVKRARFAPLQPSASGGEQASMDLLLDVRLDLRVELGRASLPVREVLQLGPGSIVSLDKLSGESVDILINGKLIARGEVVVVDENFGVRVTEMVNRADSSAQVG